MWDARFNPEELATDFEQQASAAGFNNESAELYGLLALNTVRNGGSIENHESDINTQRIAELTNDLNMDATAVQAMQHYSTFNDDDRDIKLKGMTAINGVGR